MIAEAVELQGDVDPECISRALDSLPLKHETLRTRFRTVGSRLKAQVLEHPALDEVTVVLRRDDGSYFPRFDDIKKELSSRFRHLSPERAISYTSLLAQRPNDNWLWMLAFHHVYSDAWSQYIYGKSFSKALVRGGEMTDQDVVGTSSIDYAQTQYDWLDSGEAHTQLDWWVDHLIDVPEQLYPYRCDIRPGAIFTSVRLEQRLGQGVHKGLNAISVKFRVPPIAVALACLANVLARHTKTKRTTILTYAPGRSLRGALNATGAFYNSVLLCIGNDYPKTNESRLQYAAKAVFDSWKRQEIPIGFLFRACQEKGRHFTEDSFPICLNYIKHPLSDFVIPGCQMSEVDLNTLDTDTAKSNSYRVIGAQSGSRPSGLTFVAHELGRDTKITLDTHITETDAEQAFLLLEEYVREIKSFVSGLASSPTSDNAHSGVIY